MSLAKVHLIDSDTPLKEGSDYTATCGKPIPKVVFAFMWDGEAGVPSFCYDQTRVCRKCQENPQVKRYEYGIIPGEESRHAGDE